MSNIITAERFLTIRCKAFSGEGARGHRIMVEADRVDGQDVERGAIRVWDDVAGHFTSLHTLSARTQSRIRSTFQP